MTDENIHKTTIGSAPEGEKPLVTFALFTYNQERYIAEAIQGALSQTYSPLEIVISDDCSSDRTWEVVLCELANYTGPHKLVLNRNETNLGVVEHVNKIMRMCSGELIVVAAGDDISLPNRVAELTRVWQEEDASAVYSNAELINESGLVIGKWVIHSEGQSKSTFSIGKQVVIPKFYGASAAYERDVIEKFGRIPSNVRNEDFDLAVRSFIEKGIAYTSLSLLKYRKHKNNLSFWVKKSQSRTIKESSKLIQMESQNNFANINNFFLHLKKKGISINEPCFLSLRASLLICRIKLKLPFFFVFYHALRSLIYRDTLNKSRFS